MGHMRNTSMLKAKVPIGGNWKCLRCQMHLSHNKAKVSSFQGYTTIVIISKLKCFYWPFDNRCWVSRNAHKYTAVEFWIPEFFKHVWSIMHFPRKNNYFAIQTNWNLKNLKLWVPTILERLNSKVLKILVFTMTLPDTRALGPSASTPRLRGVWAQCKHPAHQDAPAQRKHPQIQSQLSKTCFSPIVYKQTWFS